jgi:lipopolysaccharide transport system ATP-binding protein
MPLPAIEVTGLSKRYVLEHESRHDNLRDTLHHTARKLWRRARWGTGFEREEFFALSDVSFSIQPGEVVGIVGRNGAGKSTLLKILSRITEPSAGKITIRGRVASLLEVGTGFHPDLSGRENIFLNGAILGMSRIEIRKKFDEIVAFAEVERFLDTPVKRYSSGMYVRLAFAVAAHLEPDILIVDEVLAVGDVAFQKKCLGKMREVASGHGRTVLFVSHNLTAVRQLCPRTLVLSRGQLAADGGTGGILDRYIADGADAGTGPVPPPDADQLQRAYVTRIIIENEAGKAIDSVPVGQPWQVRLLITVAKPQTSFSAAVGLCEMDGTPVQTVWHPPLNLRAGNHEFIFRQDKVILACNTYQIVVGLTSEARSIQQITHGRLEISGAPADERFQTTSGVGAVLNSMTTLHREL